MIKPYLPMFLFLSLLACDRFQKEKQVETETSIEEIIEQPAEEIIVEEDLSPTITREIPDVPLGFLVAYEGKYAGQEHLFENEILMARLQGLDRFNYEAFISLWNTETPIVIEDGILHMSGCKAHSCPSNAYDFFVDLENDNINIFQFRSNMLRVHQEKGWIDLPPGFAREMEIKKENAGIGNTETIESTYTLEVQ